MSKKKIVIAICIIIVLLFIIIKIIPVYNKQIDKITIKYFEGYNYRSGSAVSYSIPLIEFDIEGNDLEELSELINNLKIIPFFQFTHAYHDTIYFDKYKLVINDNYIIDISSTYGEANESNRFFKVPEELYDKILEITDAYNQENLYQTINSNSISITYKNQPVTVTDNYSLYNLSNYQYYVVYKYDEDSIPYDEIGYILDLNDGRKIYLVEDSIFGYISYADGSYDRIYCRGLEDKVEELTSEDDMLSQYK